MADAVTGRDRVTEVRIEGMRALADVRLPMGGLTVLIGESGTGKSTILEALELLRGVANPGSFVPDWVLSDLGGLAGLLRMGSNTLRMTARVEGEGPRIDYSFALAARGVKSVVSEEHLDVWEGPSGAGPVRVIAREAGECRVVDADTRRPIVVALGDEQLALQSVLPVKGVSPSPAIDRVVRAIGGGRVHVPFALQHEWVNGKTDYAREPTMVGFTEDLERLGGNLANCYHDLQKHPAVWQRTMARVRSGLGPDVTDVKTPPAGRGLIELAVHFRGLPDAVPASALSDGQLTFLALVALVELGTSYSFLAFDEPGLHLHPGLVVRMTWLLEELGRSCPVVIATHSDRLLDALSDPAKSVVLCELDEHRATRLYRPDSETLEKWLEMYRGVGHLRAEGYERHVVPKLVDPGA